MHDLGDGVWTYTAIADAHELQGLGLPAGATARHVLVKVVTTEDGHENHRITRVTTAQWKDASGKDHGVQFTSLQGHHVRD